MAHPTPVRRTGPQPAATGGPLSYNGGAVETSPAVYVVYWGWTSDPKGEQPYLQSFLNGVGGSSWNQTVTQYCMNSPMLSTSCVAGLAAGNPSGLLKGVWSDPTPIPPTPTDAQMGAEAASALAHLAPAATASNVQIVVATPTGVVPGGTFAQGNCAYHDDVFLTTGEVSFTALPYISDFGLASGNTPSIR